MEKRNSNIELLRFLLMMGICLWHVLVHGLGYKNLSMDETIANPIDGVLLSLLVPAVNTFMLISGYYGIRFSYKKLGNLLFQGFFYFMTIAILANLLNLLGIVADSQWTNLQYILYHFCTGISNVWWFLTDYVLIMIMSPFIEKGFEYLDKRYLNFCVLVLVIFNFIGFFWNNIQDGSNFFSLLTIYILGRWLAIRNLIIHLDRFKGLSLWIAGTVLMYISISNIDIILHFKSIWWLLYYNNPIVLIQAIGLLSYVIAMPPRYNSAISFLGKHCLSIYLITEAVGITFGVYTYLASLYKNNPVFCILAIFIISIACIVFDVTRSIIFERFMKLVESNNHHIKWNIYQKKHQSPR